MRLEAAGRREFAADQAVRRFWWFGGRCVAISLQCDGWNSIGSQDLITIWCANSARSPRSGRPPPDRRPAARQRRQAALTPQRAGPAALIAFRLIALARGLVVARMQPVVE